MTRSASHIVVVSSEFPPQPGGIGTHAYHLALHLSKHGYQVRVITDQRSKTGVDEGNFDATLPFTVERIALNRFRPVMYLQRFMRTFSAMRGSSHCIATGKFSLWTVAFCRLFFKRTSIAVVHGTEVNFKSRLLGGSIDLALKQFDTIVAVSSYTKGLMANIEKAIVVIPNGISIADWRPSKHPIQLKGAPVLTTVGRVSSRKGQLNVIRQLPALVKQFPNLHYHCVGIPTEAEAFLKVAQSLGVASYVTFHGSVADDRLRQFLESTDIFVMLSTESIDGDVEGFGIAILEANAMGVPAIGSLGCGIADAIESSRTGHLIAYDDSEAFSVALNDLITHKQDYQIKARQWAEQHDWSYIITSYIALIE